MATISRSARRITAGPALHIVIVVRSPRKCGHREASADALGSMRYAPRTIQVLC
jgi:hypothetical protein